MPRSWRNILYLFMSKSFISFVFLINCPEVDFLQVYVIGSNAKLGDWKIQDGISLSYAGEFIWHASCVIKKTDFPIKYPFGVFLLGSLLFFLRFLNWLGVGSLN